MSENAIQSMRRAWDAIAFDMYITGPSTTGLPCFKTGGIFSKMKKNGIVIAPDNDRVHDKFDARHWFTT